MQPGDYLPGGLHEWHMAPPFVIDPALMSDLSGGTGMGGLHSTAPAAGPSAGGPMPTIEFLQYTDNRGPGCGRGRGGRGKRGAARGRSGG